MKKERLQKYKVPALILLVIFAVYMLSFSTMVYHLNFWESLQEKNNVNLTLAHPLNVAIVDYFQNGDYKGLEYKSLTKKESEHMVDVKVRIQVVTMLSLLFSIASIILICRQKKDKINKILLWSALGVWIIPILLFFIPFEGLFMQFHNLFFSQGTFLFDWNSLLIRVYPEDFFRDFALEIVKRAYVGGAFLFIASLRVKKFK